MRSYDIGIKIHIEDVITVQAKDESEAVREARKAFDKSVNVRFDSGITSVKQRYATIPQEFRIEEADFASGTPFIIVSNSNNAVKAKFEERGQALDFLNMINGGVE